ncbi:hypothetical protein HBI25_134850 [Parastagonospora nodorum]|nr:hypothetical protein HBI25_134850 [Parastagonospora nodorum]
MSTIGSVMANKDCPSCRLVAQHVASIPDFDTIPKSKGLSLRLLNSSFSIRQPTSTSITPIGRPLYLEIHLCGTTSSHFTDGFNYVGALLQPVERAASYGSSFDQVANTTNLTSERNALVRLRRLPAFVDVDLLKEWMSFCSVSHERCKRWKPKTDVRASLRLVDVQKRCLMTSTLHERYVALSYVWGQGTKGVLTKSTIANFFREGSLTGKILPRLIMMFLWVDTACIIQDDMQDKQRQLPIMDEIYGHATLTIIAAVTNAEMHLPRWSSNQCRYTTPISMSKGPPLELLDGVEYSTSRPNLHTTMSDTVWNTRGWTFQEGMLARRALIFTQNQVFWNCPDESWCEDQHTEYRDWRHLPTEANSLLAIFDSDNTEIREGPGLEQWCALGVYMHRVEQYTMRKFHDDSDVFWAFIGILKGLKDRFRNGYIWGLPYDHLDEALLWHTCCINDCSEGHFVPDEAGVLRRLPMPSWTWIAKGSRVRYGGCPDKAIMSRVSWLDPILYTGDYKVTGSSNSAEEVLPKSAFTGAEAPRLDADLLYFGLLHFTADTSSLTLKIDTRLHVAKCHVSLPVRILTPCGKDIGKMTIPDTIICSRCEEYKAEFILLSTHTGESCATFYYTDGSLVPKPEAVPWANIMLIEWRETREGGPYAVRLGLARVNESDWKELETTRKDIILG